MFPEISREDIFRLETRRLWLRWPQAADADAVGKADAEAPYRAAEIIARWRAENEGGAALHLALTGKGADRDAFGAVSLAALRGRPEDCGLKLQVWLAPDRLGGGYATEAAQAAIDAAFLLTGAPVVAASSGVLDPGFRRVLEKCGFAACGSGLDLTADGRGLAASDRFRLDRKAWASLKGWRMPGLAGVQRTAESVVATGPEACLG